MNASIATFSFAALLFVASVQGAIVCPPDADFNPCTCTEANEAGTGLIRLYCYNQNLDDAKINSILNSFLRPGVSPVSDLVLSLNVLTRVPDQILLLPQLVDVDMDRNKIRSIAAGSFNFKTVLLGDLELDNNQLETIEPGAFQGDQYGNGTYILLNDNQLTSFNANVFQTVLEKLAPFAPSAYIDMANNPIDCDSDPCKMAWLVRDNRQLLPAVLNGQCSNGIAFNAIDQSSVANCAV